MQAHLSEGAGFRSALSEDIDWKPFPAFPPSARLAILVGDPTSQAYPPGAVVVLPGRTPHFHWARSGEYVTQVSAIGPLGLEYLDPKHDPRSR